MKIPLSWLKDYVEIDAPPEEIAEKLTFSGTEVEGIETVGGNYEGIVVGEVLSIDPHPNADRLQLCRVSTGAEELKVVCGARNFAVGDKAPFAGIGVVLPNGMKLKRAKIRGEESQGMLCAEDELGISDDHAGIMLLPRDTVTGTPLSDVLGPPETVFELEVTWNRSDCLSVIGMARELAAVYGKQLKKPDVSLEEGTDPVEDLVRVAIDAPEGCPRYTARVLSDVRIAPSPLWMQRRLTLCGIRPICNIVDVTNYVMLECGHPLHAFDYGLLRDATIIVRTAKEGETMATLDEVERALQGDTLVIADAERPVALAGVMGGAGSEISDTTTRVLLESATFDPASIRHTSSRLSMSTESAHRFERGVDVGGVEWASRRAAALMVSLGGGTLAKGVVDVYPGQVEEPTIRIDTVRTQRLLGFEISTAEIVAALSAVALPIVEEDATGCTVRVPTFRRDLVIEADLVEEVARIHGLDKVPDAAPSCSVVPQADDSAFRSESACRANLVGLGLNEIVNYSFMSPQLLDSVPTGPESERVVLPNPVSADQSVMRPSLVPQMVATLGRNLSHQLSTAALSEIGTVYRRLPDDSLAEHRSVCIGLMGPVGRSGMLSREPLTKEESFLSAKGLIEALLSAQYILGACFEAADDGLFEPGYGALVRVGEDRIGRFGLLRRTIRSEWRMADPVAVAEFTLSGLLPRSAPSGLSAIAAFPSVSRDVAMVVNESITHAQIVHTIRQSAPAELTDVQLFDIFRGEGIGEGKKSLAYSLEFRSAERSLTDEDANGYHQSVKKALRSELGAEIRDK